MIIPLLGVISDRIIARPIKQLACVVDQFRHGRLNVDVPWTLRKDEVGLVARAIETFARTSFAIRFWNANGSS